jgi:hypothetical protein
MGYDLVERSMARFANEVLPRFRAEVYGRELDPDRPAGP